METDYKIEDCDSENNLGVCAALGFKAAGVHAGFRANAQRLDFALVVADEVCPTAATFTKNEFCAAPVLFDKMQLNEGSSVYTDTATPNGAAEATEMGDGYYGFAKAVAINSGIANAATGEVGFQTVEHQAEIVSTVLGCPKSEVLIASTGVIGVQLPLEPMQVGTELAACALSKEDHSDAAKAIMTTDTHPKEYAVSIDGASLGFADTIFHVGGMAKGSGMIMPNMATMISVITTDFPIKEDDLRFALKKAVDVSFNKITVDSDTSTNDTCILMASGKALSKEQRESLHNGTLSRDDEAFAAFESALVQVCTSLARQMARDGEGATKLVDVTVKGAKNPEDADKAARAVANSPLVKTAIAGHDANWGRIAAALGKSGAEFKQENVNIDMLGLPVCKCGLALDFDEEEALRRFEDEEISILVDLGAGSAQTTIWTCDLTHDYISINGDYRS